MKWEYKVLTKANTNDLNEAGLEGWELIAINYSKNLVNEWAYFFKRPLKT